jgi:hypothetical protein
LNSKALFNPSLKDQNPIVIEDEDTDEYLSKFSSMEERDIHTLKGMTRDKERHKWSQGETSSVNYVVVKTNYPTYMESKQNVMDFGIDPEHDSNDITPDVEMAPKQVPHDVKTNIKGKTLMMQEPVRETSDKKCDKEPKYEMRPRKYKISIEINKPVTEEEKVHKNGNKLKALIKKKLKAVREMDDNHQVQDLKQQKDDMRQKIQSLQKQK